MDDDDGARPRRWKIETPKLKNGPIQKRCKRKINPQANFKNGTSDLFTRGLG